jgi:hypothetical protein
MHPRLHQAYAQARHDELVRCARTQRLTATPTGDVTGIHVARGLRCGIARLAGIAGRFRRAGEEVAALSPR